jgi:hypothetical protein
MRRDSGGGARSRSQKTSEIKSRIPETDSTVGTRMGHMAINSTSKTVFGKAKIELAGPSRL